MTIKGIEIFQVGQSGLQSIAVAGTDTVYSDVFTLGRHEYFSVFYQSTSGGTIAVKIELQVSKDNSTWVIPDDISPINPLLDDALEHNERLAVNRAPYLRFKLTGLTGNAATTKVKIWLSA